MEGGHKRGYSESYGSEYSEAKRPRISETLPPSKVVHIRNLPPECTESELVVLGSSFGKVSNVLILSGKSQGFIEMESMDQAVALFSYYSTGTVPAFIRGRRVYFNYSNRQQISSSSSAVGQQNDTPNHILLVTVSNVLYPITIEVIHSVFGSYGQIVRIVIFEKTGGLQCLVEFMTPQSAYQAKVALDGESIYTSCCTLRIQYSKLSTVTVKYNNDKSRDFTNPMLPQSADGQGALVGQGAVNPYAAYYQAQMYDYSRMYAQSGGAAPAVIAAQMPTGMPGPPVPGSKKSEPLLNKVPEVLPDGTGGTAPQIESSSAQAGQLQQSNAAQAQAHVQQMHMHAQAQVAAQVHAAQAAAAMIGHGSVPVVVSGGTSVLLVNNLNEEKMDTPNKIFTLFGVYGDVIRVKILYNKKSSALVMFSCPQHAETALRHLNNCAVYGNKLFVTASKHQSISVPRSDNDDGADAGKEQVALTKDFTNSPLHRFKTPHSKNLGNIAPPGTVLHLSNLPENKKEEDIKQLFEPFGTIENFKFFNNTSKMANIKLSSTEEAVDALINLHDTKIDGNSLRVSFSKSVNL